MYTMMNPTPATIEMWTHVLEEVSYIIRGAPMAHTEMPLHTACDKYATY
jgi:hypothetical protein